MNSERLVFPNMVDGLVRAAGPAMTPALKASLREVGLDLDAKWPPAWPVRHIGAWLDLVAEAKSPGVPRDEALRLLGRSFLAAWQATLVGSAMALVLRTIGPVRSLARLQRAFRTGDNFTVVEVTELESPAPWRLAAARINDVFDRPTYYQGVLEQGSVLVGAKDVEVSIVRVESPGATFHLRYRS